MLGFSIFLDHQLTADDYNYLIAMRNCGFKTVFTKISEKTRLLELIKWCKNLDLEVIVQASVQSFEKIGIDLNDVGQVQSLNLTGIMAQDFPDKLVAKLSKSMPVAINAAKITIDQLADLKEYNAAFDHLIAAYNYFPEPETGIDADWFKKKNQWFKQQKLPVMAFVSGQGQDRTSLEELRGQNPLAAIMRLKELGCDNCYLGDVISQEMVASFNSYLKSQTIILHLQNPVASLTDKIWTVTPEVAQEIIRLNEKDDLIPTTPLPSQERLRGAVTINNDQYGEFSGEIKINKKNLVANSKINLLAQIKDTDLGLLNYLDDRYKIIFK